jgi:KDO2-lipid IV(A) lauroyltransferase
MQFTMHSKNTYYLRLASCPFNSAGSDNCRVMHGLGQTFASTINTDRSTCHFFRYYTTGHLMVLLFRFLSYLPLPVLHVLGFIGGWLSYVFSSRFRERINNNLTQAGLNTPAIRAAVIGNTGKTFFELPKLWLRPQKEVIARVRGVNGWALVDKARLDGKGILFLTPHLGCFEITAQYIAAQLDLGSTQELKSRIPLTVLFRDAKQQSVSKLLKIGRGTHLKLAPADLSGVRALLRALRNGEATGMLPDHVPGSGEGTWLPFFDKPAYTMTLAARLADTGAEVLFVYAIRLPNAAGYHLYFRAPSIAITGTLEERAIAINQNLEAIIRQHPGQYMWGYNRYKRPRGAPPAPDNSEALATSDIADAATTDANEKKL